MDLQTINQELNKRFAEPLPEFYKRRIVIWKDEEGEFADQIDDLVTFADKLEKATIDTIESGKMTKDLALISKLPDVTVLNSEDFIKEVRKTLEAML